MTVFFLTMRGIYNDMSLSVSSSSRCFQPNFTRTASNGVPTGDGKGPDEGVGIGPAVCRTMKS